MAASPSPHCWEQPAWAALSSHAETTIRQTHLRDLLQDEGRCAALTAEFDGVVLDYARQQVTPETMRLLFELADQTGLARKIGAMAAGEHINVTENRAVMHMALRAPAPGGAASPMKFVVDGEDVVPAVEGVRARVYEFARKLRSGALRGATGRNLVDVVSVGIGGSYLGPDFVYEALRTEPSASLAAAGRRLRFLANVDPCDVARALEGLDPETTLVVIVSKTLTTQETMLNARTLRNWLLRGLQKQGDAESMAAQEKDIISRHMVAVSANPDRASAFGIDRENVFGFWNWVGGRYSVCSAVGLLPLSIHYGTSTMEQFLGGAHAMDRHFVEAPPSKNLPILMGLIGVWNASFLKYPARALLPYAQPLLRFAAHIQQVDMESNGKRVTVDGTPLPFHAGEINFGEPGTNGQHSFYQLIHQGRTVPCDFIGACRSHFPLALDGEAASNHDALMANFFAQPDALACGKTPDDLQAEGVPQHLWPHKTFPGNRPSLSLLFPGMLGPARIGQLLALYEHRTAVQGFVWGIASFDQWGVELGKAMAKEVMAQLSTAGDPPAAGEAARFNSSTQMLLSRYKNQR